MFKNHGSKLLISTAITSVGLILYRVYSTRPSLVRKDDEEDEKNNSRSLSLNNNTTAITASSSLNNNTDQQHDNNSNGSVDKNKNSSITKANSNNNSTSQISQMNSSNTKKKFYLVISNISKRNNIRSLIQTACAFGCSGIFVVGQAKFAPDNKEEVSNNKKNDIPTCLDKHISTMPLIRFKKWATFVEYLREESIHLVGVEIHEEAINIKDFVFPPSDKAVAVLMGNEGQGIHPKHMASCNSFVKISQYGSGTASLNVNVAASIVLHRIQIQLSN